MTGAKAIFVPVIVNLNCIFMKYCYLMLILFIGMLTACSETKVPYEFSSLYEVEPEAWQSSNIIISQHPSNIVISNGEYRLNSGEWTKEQGQVQKGDRINVRVLSSTHPKDVTMCELILDEDTLHFQVKTKEFVLPPNTDGTRNVHLGLSGPDMETLGGPSPRWWKLNKDSDKLGSAVKEGLIPDIQPLFHAQIRDAVVCVGGDGRYYLTGSSGDDIWHFNDGVELWVSEDLKKWDYMGLVWSFEEDATWQKEWLFHKKAVRALWAPEIHYVKGNYFITLSMPPGCRGLLKSATGKPEGPYINALANDAKWDKDIDGSLFEDEDGAVYFVYGGGWIARMKDDMSGLAEEPVKPFLIDPDTIPSHHAQTCLERRHCLDIGREGAFLFKRNGIYYLTAADSYEGRYSSMVAMSKSIYGPYQWRHEAVPCGGGTSYFKDHEGNWWCTYFGNDNQSPFKEMPAMVKVDFLPNGMIIPAKEQPLLDSGRSEAWKRNWIKNWKDKYSHMK